MLSEEERQEIEDLLSQYDHKRAACIEALKVVQAHRGWVADDCLQDVAQLLEMTPDEVDSLATFYSLIFRQPVGKHVIVVCDSVSCWILGYEELVAHMEERLGIRMGQTTADGQFTLLPIPCLGACDRGPAMMVDDELYTNLDKDKIDSILQKYDQGES
ncbi:MAG: NADH-quinone oxidoreductase subunit NuoE [Anaerolineae bacterium]|jgi:NADH-quinone oxidoreductase subunit E